MGLWLFAGSSKFLRDQELVPQKDWQRDITFGYSDFAVCFQTALDDRNQLFLFGVCSLLSSCVLEVDLNKWNPCLPAVTHWFGSTVFQLPVQPASFALTGVFLGLNTRVHPRPYVLATGQGGWEADFDTSMGLDLVWKYSVDVALNSMFTKSCVNYKMSSSP